MFVSMWISNTAAVAMMIPIMQAVLEELEAVNALKISIKLLNCVHIHIAFECYCRISARFMQNVDSK